jgi:hypothetical protein
MSGGSFGYAHFRVEQFFEDLIHKLETQGKTDENGYYSPEWSIEVARKLVEIAEIAEYTAEMMKEVELLYSGDTGEDTFLENVRKIEDQKEF